MTIEEAIRELKIQFVGEYDRQREAKDMAIKALKEQGNPNSIRINFVGEEEAKEFKKYLKNQQPCEDIISKQAVLDEINRIGIKAFETYNDYSQLYDFVDTLPPVIPQQKTGHWIIHPNGIYAHLVCDKCLSCAPYDCKINYCPNCGVKMVGTQERSRKNE